MHTRALRTVVALAALSAAGCGVDTKSNGKVKITSVSPDTSSITGGVEVQIGGKGFDGGSEPTVVFGPNQAEVTSYSENAISVVLPGGLGCGNVDIQINNSNGFAIDENAFTYTGGSGVLTVTQITPTLGEVAGNTEVTIDGSGFTGGAGVLLNGVPLRQIEVLSDTQIRARTPPQVTGGLADLQIRNCADEESLPGAFMFTSGLNGAYVELPLVDFIRPGQFGNAPDYINPLIGFVEPTTESLLNPLPPQVDTCQYNPPAPPAVAFVYITGGAEVSLSSASQTIQLDLQDDDLYYYPGSDSTANQTTKFLFNASYTLTATGEATFPGFAAAGALSTPADFTVSAPSFASDTPATVSRTGNMQWTWTAPTPGDHVRIVLIGYSDQDNDGDGFADPTNERLNCYVVDDGSFSIPGSEMTKFSGATGQLVSYITRRKDTSFIVPANGTNGVGVALIEKAGALDFP
jgi:hypothetical protein